MANPYSICLLCGEDEFAIEEFITAMLAQTGGDATMADLNTAHLDGRAHSHEDLQKAVYALPFLADYRLVTFYHPTDCYKNQQKKLIALLDRLPPTTRLVLAEDHLLTTDRERRENKIHWLERWARQAGERVLYKEFRLPVGDNLKTWIQRRAEKAGGKITSSAAGDLSDLVGAEPRVLDQEIQKLLAYVNYSRPIEPEDVQHVTPFTARVPDFALVNALREKNTRKALSFLHRELEEKDPLQVFGSIVNQFRWLLQAREILDQGGRSEDVARLLRLRPFHAQKVLEHAQGYSIIELERIYHRLLEVDLAMKTGAMESELALDVLLLELTNASC